MGLNQRPSSEGIETADVGVVRMDSQGSLNQRPSSEGIETSIGTGLYVGFLSRLNQRPSSEGIETRAMVFGDKRKRGRVSISALAAR